MEDLKSLPQNGSLRAVLCNVRSVPALSSCPSGRTRQRAPRLSLCLTKGRKRSTGGLLGGGSRGHRPNAGFFHNTAHTLPERFSKQDRGGRERSPVHLLRPCSFPPGREKSKTVAGDGAGGTELERLHPAVSSGPVSYKPVGQITER